MTERNTLSMIKQA